MSQSQKEAAEYAEVLMAYSRGETIQMRIADTVINCAWEPLAYPLWDFARYEYRVAPVGNKKALVTIWGNGTVKPVMLREVTE